MEMDENKVKAAKETAEYNFFHGLTCCESVYEALHRSGVIGQPEIPHTSCAMCAGFGGGIGQSGLTCGALSGAVMAVGASHGNRNLHPDDDDLTYAMEPLRYNNLVRDFQQSAGSALCKEITRDYRQCFTTPERKAFCANIVTMATELACQYIAMSKEEVKSLTYWFNVAGQGQASPTEEQEK